MPTYNFIAFDIDGTLVDSNLASLKALQKTILSVEGVYWSIDQLNKVIGLSDYDALASLNVCKKEQCYSMWKKFSFELRNEKRLFPEVYEVLNTLKKRKVNLGIITSREREMVENDYFLHSVIHLFDIFITAESTPRHKPQGDPLKKLLEIENQNSDQTLFVGDTRYDFLCAKNAGVDFALAGWGLHHNVCAKFTLYTPRDILEII